MPLLVGVRFQCGVWGRFPRLTFLIYSIINMSWKVGSSMIDESIAKIRMYQMAIAVRTFGIP